MIYVTTTKTEQPQKSCYWQQQNNWFCKWLVWAFDLGPWSGFYTRTPSPATGVAAWGLGYKSRFWIQVISLSLGSGLCIWVLIEASGSCILVFSWVLLFGFSPQSGSQYKAAKFWTETKKGSTMQRISKMIHFCLKWFYLYYFPFVYAIYQVVFLYILYTYSL